MKVVALLKMKGERSGMKNKEQFKRILIFIAGLIIVLAFSKAFAHVWYEYYNSNMHDPYWKRGNILLILIYAFVYVLVTRSVSGFKVSYLKTGALFGSQILGILVTNVITYVQISLIGRGRLDVLPMLCLTAAEAVFAFVWSFCFTKLFTRIYPPRKMIIVYGNVNARELVQKMSNRQDKYLICESISCDEDIEIIKEQILKYEAVIISDVPSELRNKLLKFTLDRSIRTYINPKLSDIIIRGAEDFHLFDTPLLLSRNDGLTFEQAFAKRFMDLFLAVIAFAVASPFMLITALAIKLYDRGPVLYSQERLTSGGKVFKVYKFRSMIVDARRTEWQGLPDRRTTELLR